MKNRTPSTGKARRADSARTPNQRGETDAYSSRRPLPNQAELPLFAAHPIASAVETLGLPASRLEAGDLDALNAFNGLTEEEYRLEIVSALVGDGWTIADGETADGDALDPIEREARLDLASFLAGDGWALTEVER